MARFYAKFDHGIVSALTNTFYDRRVVNSQTSSNAASGGNPNYYGGLIASRSALSDAMKAQLDATNQDGQLGPIIPPSNTAGDTPNITRSGGNLQWTNVYKVIGSQLPGIKIPADFATRPTSSVYTDDGNLTAASPTDGGTISDSLYTAASTAVLDVLNSIKKVEGSLPYSTDGSPYVRLGLTPSRTLHSIFHNSSLDYFAWDDFTPGTMSTSGMDIQFNGADCNQTPSPGAVSTIQFTWSNTNSYEFRNDGNSAAQIGVEIEVSKASGASGTCDSNWNVARFRLQLGYSATTHGGPLLMGTGTSGTGPNNPSTRTSPGNCTGASSWTWNGLGTYGDSGTPNLTWTVKLEDCISPGYDITVSTKLYDAVITTNTVGFAGIYSEQAALPNTA